MSELQITRPAATSVLTVESRKGDKFAFAFESGDFAMSRDGSSLLFSFEDGGLIIISDFYRMYDKDEMPTFSFGDVTVTAGDLFVAQKAEGLMPAAGSGVASKPVTVSAGGHRSEFSEMSLATKELDHLDAVASGDEETAQSAVTGTGMASFVASPFLAKEKSASASDAEPQPEPEAELQHEPEVEPQHEPEAQPKHESEAQPKPAPEAEAEGTPAEVEDMYPLTGKQ